MIAVVNVVLGLVLIGIFVGLRPNSPQNLTTAITALALSTVFLLRGIILIVIAIRSLRTKKDK